MAPWNTRPRVTELKYFTALRVLNKDYAGKPSLRDIIDNYEKMNDFVELDAGMIRLSEDLYICHLGGETTYEIKALLPDNF